MIGNTRWGATKKTAVVLVKTALQRIACRSWVGVNILGSNPTNGGSSFLFTPSPTQPTNTAFCIDFTTVSGRLYTVECTDELGSGNWQVLTNFIGDGSTVQLIVPADIPACFYQIRIDGAE